MAAASTTLRPWGPPPLDVTTIWVPTRNCGRLRVGEPMPFWPDEMSPDEGEHEPTGPSNDESHDDQHHREFWGEPRDLGPLPMEDEEPSPLAPPTPVTPMRARDDL